jgi:CopG-like RHH_1 or ribbon-helix-helix domain, RHH_5
MKANGMSKRYNITLPDGVAEKLEEWADGEKNKPSTLAAFIVEAAVREWVQKNNQNPVT